MLREINKPDWAIMQTDFFKYLITVNQSLYACDNHEPPLPEDALIIALLKLAQQL